MENSNLRKNPAEYDPKGLHGRITSPWLPWTRRRLLAVLLVFAAYCAAFIPLYNMLGGIVAATAVVPAVVAGWLLGTPAGIIAGALLSLVVNAILFTFAGISSGEALRNGFGVGQLLIIAIGGGAGWSSELLARMRLTTAWINEQQMELRRQQEFSETLTRMSIALVRHLDVKELLQDVVTRAGQLVGTNHGYLYWREAGQGIYSMRVGTGVYGAFVGATAQPGVGLAGTVIQSGNYLVVDDYPSWGQRLRDPSRDILRAVAGVPLKSGDTVVGVIGLAFTEKDRKFGAAEIDVLNRFAQLASVALDNAESYAEAQREIAERKRTEAELKQTEQFLDSVIDNLPLMLFAKDAKELRFVRWNKAGEELMGFMREEMAGKNDFDLVTPEQAEFFIKKDRDVLSGKQLVDIPEEVIQTRFKGTRYLHTRKIPILDANGEPQYLLGISEDITERRRIEENVLRLNAYLMSLHETSVALMQHRDTSELLTNIVTQAGKLIGTQNGYVYLADATGQASLRVGVGLYSDMVGQSLRPGVGLAGKVWESGRPLVIDEYRDWPGRLMGTRRDVLRAVVGVPLRVQEQVVGVIGLAHMDEVKFGEAEVQVLAQFANLAALAIENARLFEQTQTALAETRRLAEREATVTTISDRLYARQDVHGILEAAVQELRRVTGRELTMAWLGSTNENERDA